MRLSACREPYPDELFYGYVRSLAQANGMDRMLDMETLYLNRGEDNAHVRILYSTGLARICGNIQNHTFPGLRRTMLMTPYYAMAAGITEGERAKLAEAMIQTESPAVPEVRGREKGRIHICPKCWEEDKKKYGEGYLHLSHHLPGVTVCYKHQCHLEEIVPERGRERMKKISPGIGKALIVPHRKEAVEYAKKMSRLIMDGQFMLLETVCKKCGKVYMEHPYSKRTACGCPYCNEKQSPEDVMNRRLKKRFGNEYTVKPGFTALHTAVVIHNPCGAERRELRKLIYGEPTYCKECTKLVPEYLQRRFDPAGENWIFCENSETLRKRKKMRVLHKKCGRVSSLSTWQFLKKEGGYCPYCDNPKNRVDITEVDPAYEIVGNYQNNHERIDIRHKDCGFTFSATKSAFLHGTRCPVCTPRYVFADVKVAVDSHTDGYELTRGKRGGYADLKCPDGRWLCHLSFKDIMNDLQAENPVIFYDREQRYTEKYSLRRQIYDAIKLETKKKGYWTPADGLDGKSVAYIYKRRIQDMTRLGIIQCIGEEKYTVEERL